MPNEKLVSIIIPVYGVEKYIEASVLSALSQTYKNIEFIIVDDCSTDDSMKIINQIKNIHKRGNEIKIFKHNLNRGLSAARNTGIENSSGEYIFFMDSDDEITSNCIESLYKIIINENADFSIGNIKIIGSKSVHVCKMKSENKENGDILKSFFSRKYAVSACNKLYNRNFINEYKIRFIEGLLHEDYLWSYYVAINAKKMAIIQDETYLYITRKQSITSSTVSEKKINSFIFILSKIISDWNDNNIPVNIKYSMFNFLTFIRFNVSLLLLLGNDKFFNKAKNYKKINCNDLSKYGNVSIIFILLKLPYLLFSIVLIVPYYLYKFFGKIGI